VHVLSALFVVNGVSAFLAHYLGTTAWHNIDSKSMLLAVWLGSSFLMSELLGNAFRTLGGEGGSSARLRSLLGAMAWVVPMLAYWWIAESNATLGEREYGHRLGAIATAAPLLVCVVVGMVHVCLGWGKTASISARSYAIARSRFVLGCLLCTTGSLAWTVTENLCDRDDALGHAFRWFPGHAVWHVTMAYGLTMALLFACALRAPAHRTMVYIRTDSLYYFFLPRLNYDAARGVVRPVEQPSPPSTERLDERLVKAFSRRVPSWLRRAEFVDDHPTRRPAAGRVLQKV